MKYINVLWATLWVLLNRAMGVPGMKGHCSQDVGDECRSPPRVLGVGAARLSQSTSVAGATLAKG